MNYKLTIIAIILICKFQMFSKGITGEYTFSGKIYISGTLQKNYQFYINGEKISSDSLVFFFYKVKWSTNCPSGTNIFNRRKWLKKNNPKYIVLKFGEQEVKVRNKWKRYGLRQVWEKEKKQMYKEFSVGQRAG